ncbi:Hsp90 cochaperone [Phlyctochytrium planicorne]|nr:Hsp90 cochaperone [Phlyctochytrium planicorne]
MDQFNLVIQPAISSSAPRATRPYPRPTPPSVVISEARASLRRPSRPFTPAVASRDSELFHRLENVKGVGGKGGRPDTWLRKHVPRRLDPLSHQQDRFLAPHEGRDESNFENEYATSSVASMSRMTSEMSLSTSEQYSASSPSHSASSPQPPSSSSQSASNDPSHQSSTQPPSEQDQAWNTITTLLSALEGPHRPHRTNPELNAIFETFHVQLSNLQWLRTAKGSGGEVVEGGRRVRDKRRRDFVLHALMRWMEESGDAVVAIGVCGVVIRLTHDERVLMNTFKLMFKLSNNERNDKFFQNKRVLGSVLNFLRPSTSPTSIDISNLFGPRCDLWIYATGTLKNISDKEVNQRILIQCGCVGHLAHLISTLTGGTDLVELPRAHLTQTTQLLIQITATLRNLANIQPFAEKGAVDALMKLMDENVGVTDSESLMLNVARILSKLSLEDECLARMSGEENVAALVQLVIKYQNNKALLVRIFFVLGNITSTLSENHRHLLPSIPDLVAILGIYSVVALHRFRKKEGKLQGWGEDVTVVNEVDDEEATRRIEKENADVLVKLIRVLANLSLDPECAQEVIQMIEIEALVDILGYADTSQEEELVLNIAGALANFTFYLLPSNCLIPHATRILEMMVPLLLSSNSEFISEASRVVGNLSRVPNVVEWMGNNKGGVELLTVLLGYGDEGVLENVCGAIANVLAAGDGGNQGGSRWGGVCGKVVVEGGGVIRLAELASSFLPTNLHLALTSLTALSNLFKLSSSLPPHLLEDLIPAEEEEYVGDILSSILESETLSGLKEGEWKTTVERFINVANAVLDHVGVIEVEDDGKDDMLPTRREGGWAEDLKAQGNKAFSSGDFKNAISLFTQAINLDPSNHVLYSNRSACYASLKDYATALADAEKTVDLNTSWAKGYSRKGAALYGLSRFKEAVEAYQAGLALEPGNSQLQKGLKDAEAALEDLESNGLGGGFSKLFGGDVFGKIASNPKLAPLLAQPDFIQKVRDCQANPKNIEMYMQDPRMMSLVFALMGIDATATDNMDTTETPIESTLPKQEKKAAPPAPEPEPEEEVDEEEKERKEKRKRSDAEKDKASAFYKKREFENALESYEKAWELDDTNVAVLTNKSAVLFEMGKYDECIQASEDAVEKGRELRADFKLIARAFGRIGSAYLKKDDLPNAIKYYQKSLAEHRTPDILNKLRECEKLKEKADKEAYRSIPLSDEAREKGNQLFKEAKYADAVPLYTEAIKRNDKDPRNYSNRAACYTKLMAFNEAERDCDEAIKLDENFIKAYIRKAAILFGKRDYMKCVEMCNDAKRRDVEGKHTAEIDGQIMRAYAGLNEIQSGANREETMKRAMNDPEVQKVLGDPVMQSILQQMKEDPAAAQDHMKNPAVAAKIRILINAGVIQMR